MVRRICCLLPLLLLLAIIGSSHVARTAGDLGVPSTTGLVVSASDLASDAGAAILRKGGNAVDAAVATGFALAVTYPAAGNIGGGGFMIIRLPSGELTALDYRERAPLKSTPDMYLDAEGNIDRSLTRAGYLAPGVPGSVRGMALAHREYGSLPWPDLVMPAVTLAEEGFLLSSALASSLNTQLAGEMGRFPASVAAYGKPGGGAWRAGDRIVLADLGRTLRAIATDGPDAFYTGWIADRIAADMKANGGLITREDLAAYEAKLREPVRGRFRDYEIVSMPPPSSGGVALVQMLNILEPFDLKARDRFAPRTLHLMSEAMRRAFLDRARHLGDPDFVEVPVARLTSKAYARQLAGGIDSARASNSVALGRDIVTVTEDESPETTHYSVLDRNGMAVSCTTTLEDSYGSKAVVAGAGFLLNNEMGDFNRKPGETTVTGDIGTAANVIAPGKRMLSSMTPTILLHDGRVALVTGSPGGRTIINTVLAVVLNVTEFGMNARQAVDAKRMHHQWLPDRLSLEEAAVSESVLEQLRAMGHDVRQQGRQGDAHTIFVDPTTGVAYGVNDRRSADSKASIP
jgi:gamma-glutamyltranspeptidase / glutathione hydrolase